MAQLIATRRRVETVYWQHSWTWRHNPGVGYCIESDADGRIADDRTALYEWCMANDDLVYDGLVSITGAHWEPGIVLCDCGERVALCDSWPNSCRGCVADYDGNGRRLAPRSQWGEETGEGPGDILISSW